jgi:hypothetical protein
LFLSIQAKDVLYVIFYEEVIGGYIGSNPNSLAVLNENQWYATLMRSVLEKGKTSHPTDGLDLHFFLYSEAVMASTFRNTLLK